MACIYYDKTNEICLHTDADFNSPAGTYSCCLDSIGECIFWEKTSYICPCCVFSSYLWKLKDQDKPTTAKAYDSIIVQCQTCCLVFLISEYALKRGQDARNK